MLISSIYASAYDIEQGGLYFSYINEGKDLQFDSCQAGVVALVIPDEVTYHDRTRKVTAIGSKACRGDSSIVAVAIPNTVVKIGDNAFVRTAITNLISPGSVEEMGTFAFAGCRSLTSVSFGSGVKTIGEQAFMYCVNLTKVVLPVNLETLGKRAFEFCQGLTELDIRSGNIQGLTNLPSVKKLTIGPKVNTLNVLSDYAKEGKYLEELNIDDLGTWCNLTLGNPLPLREISSGTPTKINIGGNPVGDLNIPDGVTRISKSIFNNWPITGVIIPNSVTELEEGCFANNKQLRTVSIGTGITKIPEGCFENSMVNNLQLPSTIREIGARAFMGNTFPTITLPSTLRRIGRMAFKGSKLTSITIPNSVKFVGAAAFADIADLSRADVNCDTLDCNAFKNCTSMKQLTLGPNVKCFASTPIDTEPRYEKDITDGQIFIGCPLNAVICHFENPFPFVENMFEKDTYFNATLMIPSGTMNRFKSTDFWGKFIYITASK